MKIKRSILSLVLTTLLSMTGAAYAALEWQQLSPLELKQEPLDLVSSPDGKRIYVLGKRGVVEVYDAMGKRELEIKIPFKAEGLDISADGKKLYLKETGKKRLQVIALEERYNIPPGKSPFKGAADAAVAVVVYSDFQ